MYKILLLSPNWEDTELLDCLNSYKSDEFEFIRLPGLFKNFKSHGTGIEWKSNYLSMNGINLIVINSYVSNIKDWAKAAKVLNIPSIFIHTNSNCEWGDVYNHIDFTATTSIVQRNSIITKEVDASRIFVTGSPLLDKFKRTDNVPQIKTTQSKESFLDRLSINNKKVICYISNSCVYDPEFKELKYVFEIAPSDCFLVIKDITNPKVYVLLKDLKDRIGHFIDFKNELPLNDCMQFSDAVITDNIDNAIQAVLSSKPTTILNSSKYNFNLTDFCRESGLNETLDFNSIFTPLNFNPKQFNYLLLNYLPGTFDGNNLNRFMLLVRFTLNLKEATNKYRQDCIKGFSDHNLSLIDPLAQHKEEAKRHLTTEF